MSRRVRTAARIGAFAALALLLTGCIKLNMNLVINSNDTVSGTIQLGVQKELLELTGQSVEDLLGTSAPFPSDVPGVTVEPFDDGEFVGSQFTFESVPLTEFAGTGAEEINISRSGDTFVITGVLDLSSGLSGATGFTGFGETGAALFESAQIELAFTFPGDVIETDANGQIDGNTVTYTPAFGERLEINATGSAVDDGDAAGAVGGDDGGSNLVLILIIVAAVVVVVIVIVFVMRSRKGGGGGTAAPGFGDAPAATPVAGGPAPGAPMGGAPPPMPPAAPPPPPEA